MNMHKVQDFVVEGKEIFVGLEDSKRTWRLAVRCERMLVHQTSMEAKYPLLKQYLKNRFPGCSIHVVYEAGFKGFNLYDRLTEDGIECIVIPPHMVTEPKVSRVKTDGRDANRLARIMESHDFKDPCHVPDKERREDRQVSRTLIAIQKDIVCTRNRIRRFLDYYGIKPPFADKERWGRKEFHALRELDLGESLKIGLAVLLTHLEQLWCHQATLRSYLRGLCSKERYVKAFRVARSLPGIGWFTAIRLVLELGEDLSRFTSGKSIASFVGITCREYSTGQTERKGCITGMGSAFIRHVLVENAWVAIKRDQVLLSKFLRVWKSSGSKKKAIVAVARVMIVRLRACIIAGRPYMMGVVR